MFIDFNNHILYYLLYFLIIFYFIIVHINNYMLYGQILYRRETPYVNNTNQGNH